MTVMRVRVLPCKKCGDCRLDKSVYYLAVFPRGESLIRYPCKKCGTRNEITLAAWHRLPLREVSL